MELGDVVDKPAAGKATPGNIPQVLQHMADNLQDSTAQVHGLRSLQMMLEFGQSQQDMLCRARGPEAIVAAMTAHGQDAELHCHAALVCAFLVQGNKQAQAATLEAGAAEAAIAAMQSFAAEGAATAEELLASVAVALAALCQENPDGAARVCAAGGPSVVVEAMCLQSDDGLAIERGCQFFAALAASAPLDDDQVRKCLCSDVVEAVVAGMLRFEGNAALQAAGCCALREIAVAGSRAVFDVEPSSWIKCIIAAMAKHKSKTAILQEGSQALGAAAERDAELRSACLHLGAADAVVTVIRTACKHRRKELLHHGCHALGCLAADADEPPQAVLKAGGPEAIVQAMRSYQQDAAFQEACLVALTRMGKGSVGLSAVAQAGALAAIQETQNLGLQVGVELLQSLERENAAGSQSVKQ